MPMESTPTDGTSADRFEFWRALVGHSFVPLEALLRETADFRATLRSARPGPLQVSASRRTRTASRTPDGTSPPTFPTS
ncbi:hypothetical protein ACFU53_38270 [Streptomyces sp. NPDC057474]|uniref:hypothetical protein n=1 Tax=Streptomyces sp. NPDC057474 TaxID=3346144 RepID=UPI0036B135E5